jgi:alpha-1,2-mannosyltransferase
MNDRQRRWIWAAAAVLAALWVAHALPLVNAALRAFPFDGRIDWEIARAWRAGFDPYSPDGFAHTGRPGIGIGHPPTTGFWFLPLAQLSLPAMQRVVCAWTVAFLLLHTVLVAHELELPAAFPVGVAAFGMVLSTSWMLNHLELAQLSETIAFSYVLAWLALRRGRDALGGALLGLACTFKLFPGVMVLMLLLTRRWRAVAAALAAWSVVALVMTWRFGARSWLEFMAMQDPISQYWVSDLANQSIHGIVLRLFLPSCHGNHAPQTGATLIALAASLALLLLADRLWRRLTVEERAAPRAFDLHYALFSLLSVFLNPWAWEHYNVFLVLPLGVSIAALGDGEVRRRAARLAGAAAILTATLLLSIHKNHKWWARRDLLHHVGPHWKVHAFEVANWLPLAITLVLVASLLAQRRKPAP